MPAAASGIVPARMITDPSRNSSSTAWTADMITAKMPSTITRPGTTGPFEAVPSASSSTNRAEKFPPVDAFSTALLNESPALSSMVGSSVPSAVTAAMASSPVPRSASGAALRVMIIRIPVTMNPSSATVMVNGHSHCCIRCGTGSVVRSGEGILIHKETVSLAMAATAPPIALASALTAPPATAPAASLATWAPPAVAAPIATAGAAAGPRVAPSTDPAASLMTHEPDVNGLHKMVCVTASTGITSREAQ